MLIKSKESTDIILEQSSTYGRLYQMSDASRKLIRDILTILSTRKGSLLHNQSKGVIFYDRLFALANDGVVDEITSDIQTQLALIGIVANVSGVIDPYTPKLLTIDLQIPIGANEVLEVKVSNTEDIINLLDVKTIFHETILDNIKV